MITLPPHLPLVAFYEQHFRPLFLRGRPPLKNRAEIRDRKLDTVRFSAAELERLRQAADQSGQRWSDWVRGRLGLG